MHILSQQSLSHQISHGPSTVKQDILYIYICAIFNLCTHRRSWWSRKSVRTTTITITIIIIINIVIVEDSSLLGCNAMSLGE